MTGGRHDSTRVYHWLDLLMAFVVGFSAGMGTLFVIGVETGAIR